MKEEQLKEIQDAANKMAACLNHAIIEFNRTVSLCRAAGVDLIGLPKTPPAMLDTALIDAQISDTPADPKGPRLVGTKEGPLPDTDGVLVMGEVKVEEQGSALTDFHTRSLVNAAFEHDQAAEDSQSLGSLIASTKSRVETHAGAELGRNRTLLGLDSVLSEAEASVGSETIKSIASLNGLTLTNTGNGSRVPAPVAYEPGIQETTKVIQQEVKPVEMLSEEEHARWMETAQRFKDKGYPLYTSFEVMQRMKPELRAFFTLDPRQVLPVPVKGSPLKINQGDEVSLVANEDGAPASILITPAGAPKGIHFPDNLNDFTAEVWMYADGRIEGQYKETDSSSNNVSDLVFALPDPAKSLISTIGDSPDHPQAVGLSVSASVVAEAEARLDAAAPAPRRFDPVAKFGELEASYKNTYGRSIYQSLLAETVLPGASGLLSFVPPNSIEAAHLYLGRFEENILSIHPSGLFKFPLGVYTDSRVGTNTLFLPTNIEHRGHGKLVFAVDNFAVNPTMYIHVRDKDMATDWVDLRSFEHEDEVVDLFTSFMKFVHETNKQINVVKHL